MGEEATKRVQRMVKLLKGVKKSVGAATKTQDLDKSLAELEKLASSKQKPQLEKVKDKLFHAAVAIRKAKKMADWL